MALQTLNESSPWRLVNPAHDVRGMTVRGPGGSSHGTAETLLIDTKLEEVYGIELDTGRTFAARQIRIGDGEVITEGTRSEQGERNIVKEFGQPIRIMERLAEGEDEASDSFDDRFRTHFTKAFLDAEDLSYEDVAPVYWFAHRMAQQGHFQGRTYEAARRSLQSHYRKNEDLRLTFERIEPALRFAFRQARSLTL